MGREQLHRRAFTVAASVPAPLRAEAEERLCRAVETGATRAATAQELRRVFAGLPAAEQG